jgi:PPM family protein phosphatase
VDYRVAAVGRTDTGLVKPNNEDSFFIGDRLIVVADGVGGAVAGEVASATVASAFADVEQRSLDTDPYRVLGEAVELSTDRLAALLRKQPDLEGMGTTATAMIVSAKRLVFAQIGDSRAYYLPNRWQATLHQVTRDDSFVQYLIEAGTITPAQAWRHPKRHVILKALNGMSVSPTFSTYAALPGDRYLLCSDGLSDAVPPERIEQRLRDIKDRSEVADRLIQDALEAGAPDNVTVVVVDLERIGDAQGGGTELDAPTQPLPTG